MHNYILKQNHTPLFLALLLLDVALLLIAEVISCNLILQNEISFSHIFKSVISISIFIFPIFFQIGVYEPFRDSSYTLIIKKLYFSFMAFFAIFSFFIYLINQSIFFEKFQSLALYSIIATKLFIGKSIFLMLILRYIRKRGLNTKKIAIIGSGKMAQIIQEKLSEYLWTGYRVLAFIKIQNEFKSKDTISGIPIYSEPDDLVHWIDKNEIDEIWFALPQGNDEKVKDILWKLRHKPIPKRYIPDVIKVGALSQGLVDIDEIPIIDLENSKISGNSALIKNIIDKILSLFILIMISPILLLISFCVKLTSKGPIFFKQKRYGIYGNIITVYKFRTMKVHSESKVLQQARKKDIRLTVIGSFLRSSSLDELPQFFNVLQGRMSIVGPRPHAISHNEYYKDYVTLYMQRHLIKPGITGLAQVNGARGETETIEKMQTRINLDIQYIKNWSIFLDLKIIILTIFKGFMNKNAY
ncbi:undecaprenyl-phosphate glucose phosphotransferase [Fluviispira multicolorata]|uniref:Undecaprenyl-phosphate glucose phosphotransferase n=1 Tax=Fluviispira multicolorata TaxID=2654512 RepID=A0A833N6K5_9BACT|nr:undecaprenyl-phosphate glucose phosphotransferase [Fluviispira multicolorata]KAB8030668.1 undecaprenyl-phosphate glucose phosphotransferase [Fluviispira multicolorata]